MRARASREGRVLEAAKHRLTTGGLGRRRPHGAVTGRTGSKPGIGRQFHPIAVQRADEYVKA